MRLLFLVLLSISSASFGYARELIAEVQIEGKAALIFDDGFWRFDDSVGEICTPTFKHGAVCALPSKWSPLPQVEGFRGLPEFVQSEFTAQFGALYHWGDGGTSMEKVSAYISERTTYNGLQGSVLLNIDAKIGELEGRHVVINAGYKGVFAFTFANQNGRFLIAETRDPASSLYHSWHRKAHSSFVEAVRPSPFEEGQ